MVLCMELARDIISPGKLFSVVEYKHDKSDGECTSYFENGRVKVEKTILNGYPIGVIRYYNEDGTIEPDESKWHGIYVDNVW